MKRCQAFCIVLLLLITSSGFAAPTPPSSVTLFPSRALLTIDSKIDQHTNSSVDSKISIELPIQADPASLRLAESSFSIIDMQIEQRPSSDSPEVTKLKKQLNALKSKYTSIEGKISGLNAQISFWSKGANNAATAKELLRIATAIDTQLAVLYPKLFPLQQELLETDKEIKRVTSILNKAVGGDPSTTWNIVITLSAPPVNGSPLRYSYILNRCGWRPSYRFMARPDSETIDFSYDANIHQSSGMNWTNIPVLLATIPRTSSLEPPHVPSWIIRERELLMMDAVMEKQVAQTLPAKKAMRAAPPVVNRIERTSYMEWNLGKRTLPAGQNITLPVTQEKWKAKFHYTVRPSRDSRAYLTAEAILPTDRQLMRGEALFLTNEALLGKRTFSLSGKKATLFFGNDPLVTAKMDMLTKQSGEEGFIGRKRTRKWEWKITCENRRSYPVALQIEEPEPQSQHKDISVTIESTPKSKKKDHVLIWDKTLSARSKPFIIKHAVIATAPKSLEVDFGRYR